VAEHGQRLDVESISPHEPIDVELVEDAARPEAGVVDHQIDRMVRRRDPLGGRRLTLGGGEIGLEHLEARRIDQRSRGGGRHDERRARSAHLPRRAARAISAPMPEDAPVTRADVNGYFDMAPTLPPSAVGGCRIRR
jgi:hypothetical protein